MEKLFTKKQNASITVFLSLVLLMVLSLIMTVIEGARQTTARVFAERALTTSMDSVLAAFYGPLMKEYHLLGLYISPDESYEDSEIAGKMEDYISYTITPRKDLNGNNKPLELYGISLKSVEVKNKTRLTDYQGELFIHEATEYMKYKELQNAAEFFLEKVSVLEQPKKVSTLYEEKVKVEEELVAIDEGILALMKYIDGVSTGKKGLVTGKDGILKTENHFAKKIMFSTPTMESTGINNEAVFNALKNKYINPSGKFDSIESNFETIQELQIIIKDLEVRENQIYAEIESANLSLSQLKETLSNSKDDEETDIDGIKDSINDINSNISRLEDEASSIRSNIEVYKEEISSSYNSIATYGYEISNLVSGSLSAVEQAIYELDKIIKASEDAEPLIDAYEKTLNKEKDEISKDIFESLKEGLDELKRYQFENKNGYNFPEMKNILENNQRVLINCKFSLNRAFEALGVRDLISAKTKFNDAYNELLAYQTEGLNLDYSSLIVKKEDTPDYLGTVKDLIEDGITALVIDHDTISEKVLSSDDLPSVLAMLSGELKGFSFSDLFKKMKVGNKNSNMDGLFGSFDDYSLNSILGKTLDLMAKRILLMEYIDEHFYGFPCKDSNEQRKPSVLDYEREYLLCGKDTDEENLESVILKLILIRTLLNFTSILGDKKKWNEAKLIATTLVGFTGLPILVAITQSILMILLAFASGLVDTCALLMGKELPILRKQVDLNYLDLLLITRNNIQKKAEAIKDERGFTYKDYLTLFLYLTNDNKLAYRMMDLIQENIKIRYGEDFRMSRCIFGYESEAVFNIKPLFTTFSFVKEHLLSEFEKVYITRAGYSY